MLGNIGRAGVLKEIDRAEAERK